MRDIELASSAIEATAVATGASSSQSLIGSLCYLDSSRVLFVLELFEKRMLSFLALTPCVVVCCSTPYNERYTLVLI